MALTLLCGSFIKEMSNLGCNIYTGALLIIEINTLPGLTPSTVFYHQALAENPPIFPRELLEKIIKNSF